MAELEELKILRPRGQCMAYKARVREKQMGRGTKSLEYAEECTALQVREVRRSRAIGSLHR